jgi:hypothetical protein
VVFDQAHEWGELACLDGLPLNGADGANMHLLIAGEVPFAETRDLRWRTAFATFDMAMTMVELGARMEAMAITAVEPISSFSSGRKSRG